MNIIKINIIEVASELAEEEMNGKRIIYGDEHYENTFLKEENDIISYTEEGQDLFNELYDKYYTLLDNLKQ